MLGKWFRLSKFSQFVVWLLLIVVVYLAVTGCTLRAQSEPSSSTVLEHGSINTSVTQDNINKTICKKGYTKTIRPPVSYTNRMKEQLMKEQNWKGPRPILDHYIPLQGGGDPDDKENFLLQPKGESYKKDAVEDQMNDDICDGRVSLRDAQIAMGKGWKNYEKNVR